MTTYIIGPVEGGYTLESEYGIYNNETLTEIVFLPTYESVSEGSLFWPLIAPSGIPIRPYRVTPYHTVWNATLQEWEVDQTTFTPALRAALKNRRNESLIGIVNYNGVYAMNDSDNRNLVVSIISLLEQKNDENYKIDWKGEPDPLDPDVLPRWTEASLADFQGLMISGGMRTQKAFSAEKAVLDAHQVTPFEFIEDGLDTFDTYFNS